MKNIIAFLIILFLSGYSFAQNSIGYRSETFETLSGSFEQDSSNLSKIFDGNNLLDNSGIFSENVSNFDFEEMIDRTAPQYELMPASVLHAVNLKGEVDKLENKQASTVEFLEYWEKRKVKNALKLLEGTTIGKPLAEFQKIGSQNPKTGKIEPIEILWANLDYLDKSNYAEAVHRKDGTRVIYLNKNKKDLFWDNNSKNRVYLASILAHELTHHIDMKNIGEPDRETTEHLFLELRGHLNQIYVYHELLAQRKAPRPRSGKEKEELQTIRFYLALRQYANGLTRKPNQKDFPLIKPLEGRSFPAYVDHLIGGRKGLLSLAGVLKDNYFELEGVDENPSNSSKQYKALRAALGEATTMYIDWYKEAYPPVLNLWDSYSWYKYDNYGGLHGYGENNNGHNGHNDEYDGGNSHSHNDGGDIGSGDIPDYVQDW